MKKYFAGICFLTLILFSGCDWFRYGFMNSIPFSGDTTKNPDVYVYLAVDGLAYQTVEKARAAGSFAGSEWKLAKFISMFPATSDASWTRILHTKPLEGYEYSYFNPNKDKIENKGFLGLAKHMLPTLVDGMSLEAPYLKAFDYRANGYLHMVGVYHDIWPNLAESLDNLFFTLSGRSENRETFSSYVLEFDAMGHILSESDVLKAVSILFNKIEGFKRAHPERRFHFTIFSDHGMDFVRVPIENLIEMTEEFPKVGIKPVESLTGEEKEIAAVPIDHTRVTYLSVHTLPQQAEIVARRTSNLPSVDVTVARRRSQESLFPCYGIWAEGNLQLSFCYEPNHGHYQIAANSHFARFGLSASDISNEMTEDQLFQLTRHTPYPDLFYRVRSGLTAVGINYPADVLISFRPGFVEMGFRLPTGNDFSLSGFHGSLREIGSLGTLLTTERPLPDAVRSDNFLELFPRMKRNIEEKGIRLQLDDPKARLNYKY